MTSIAAPSRDLMPDLLRAWALFGIALVNVEVFSSNLNFGYSDAAKDGALNHWAYIFVAGFFTLKSFTLFSMMFGAGLGYQIASAERAGKQISGRYFRRMAGLLVLGILHAVFFFIGDILITYAILGCLLFVFRASSVRDLVIFSTVFFAIQLGILFIMGGGLWIVENLNDPTFQAEMQKEFDAAREQALQQDRLFVHGSFFDVARMRAGVLAVMLPTVIFVQGFAALAFFLIGFAFYRLGWISDPHHRFWKLSRRVFLPIGIVLSLLSANLLASTDGPETSTALFALTAIMASSALSTLGYAGLIAKICQSSGVPILRFLARGGSASLTAYLMQSLIMSLVFSGYGLGLYNQIGVFHAVLIAFATALFSICFTSIWLLYFKRGPMEIVLRRWTYLGE